MKKLLVALATASLALGGATAPASATVTTAPTITNGTTTITTAAVGDTVVAVAGVYSGGESLNAGVAAPRWWMCDTISDPAAVMANASSDCSRVLTASNDNNAFISSASWTIPHQVFHGNNNFYPTLTKAKFYYWGEYTTVGWRFSNPITVTESTTLPSIGGAVGNYVQPGDTITRVAGTGLPTTADYQNTLLYYCTTPATTVQGTNVYAPTASGSGTCGPISGTTFPYTVSTSFYDGFNSVTIADATGYWLYMRDYYYAVQGSANFFSQGYQIGVAAQTVTYDANNGAGAIAASVSNGARNVSDGAGFSQSGFTFSGWNTAANGSGTAVAAGASYTPSGNVTLYAQWTRIPTPPKPLFTSPIAVAPTNGVLNLGGTNLANLTSIKIDDVAATITTSASGQVTVALPTLAPGKYDITIANKDGAIRFIDGLVVPDPNAKKPAAASNNYVAASTVKVTGGAVTAKQTAALKAFVSQYKDAKQATVYIRTSKAGLAAAKRAASAMLAAVAKTVKGVRTAIVVDSTSETKTSLDLVVND